MDIINIKGLGPKTLEYLNKLNLYTIQDLIEYYPYRYNIIKVSNIKDIQDGENCTIKGIVDTEPRVSYINKRFNRMTFRVNSDGILLNITIFNRAFYKTHLKLGRMINIIGKYDKLKNSITASDIKFEIIRNTKIEPVYHLVNGIKSNNLSNIIKECYNYKIDLNDYIPNYLIERYNFLNKLQSSYNIHFPSSTDLLKQSKIRTIYEEFFIFMFKMHYLKHKYDLNNQGLKREVSYSDVNNFITSLPFTLTPDQLTSVNDIYNDLTAEYRMNRLVLGDVGSGKTLVAEIAMYINYLSGYQSAMMAPTEILATQHYENMTKLFKDYDIKIGLLVGSMKKSEKNKVCKQLENGEIDFISTRFEEKIYFQVTYILADDNVIEREFGAYKNIQDNYPKYVISTDTINMSQDGIIHKNIIDWLLNQ